MINDKKIKDQPGLVKREASIVNTNKEEYLNDLKMQAIRLQIEKIVHMDPMLKSLFNNNNKPIKYARPLKKNQINRSFEQNQI